MSELKLTGTLSSGSLTGNLKANLIRGKSAYDLAVENGYTGTVTQWLASLRGQDYDHSEEYEELSEQVAEQKTYITQEYEKIKDEYESYETLVSTSTSEMETAHASNIGEMNTLKTTSISAIENLKGSSITGITSLRDSSLSSLETKRSTSEASIGRKTTDGLTQIQNLIDSFSDFVTDETFDAYMEAET